MGNYPELQLRESSLQTKLLLRDEQAIIEHLSSQKTELNEPINRIGDTVLHYAAYWGLREVLKFGFENGGNILIENHRGQRVIDVGNAQTREWMWRVQQVRRKKIQEEQRQLAKRMEDEHERQMQKKKKTKQQAESVQFISNILMGR